MSQENVEIVRTALEASQRNEGRYDLLDPDFAWDFSAYTGLDVAPKGTGRENFRRLMERYRRAWLDYHIALKELVDAGSEVVVVVHETARLKHTEMLVERDMAQVLTLQDGRDRPNAFVPNEAGGPRSRGAAGVGDVAGERGDRAGLLRGVERRRHGCLS
jgi:ketosteroid isomerase-like protein